MINLNSDSTSSPAAKEPQLFETLTSDDGRYTIFMNPDYKGYVQIVEYDGFAPRREVSRISVPFEFLATLMDKMLFNATDTGAIMVEPSPKVHAPVVA